MNWKLVLVCVNLLLLTSNGLLGQKYIPYLELGKYEKDSVFAVDCSKLKLKAFPKELADYPNLTHLNLSKNPMQTVEGLENMVHLQHLNIDKVKLVYFPIEVIRLTELRELILSRNDFEVIPKDIKYLKNLEFLDLYGTMILSLPQEIQHLTQLKRIDFTGVSLNATEQKAIKELLPEVKFKMDAPCNCMSH